jgi:hypothetical protein
MGADGVPMRSSFVASWEADHRHGYNGNMAAHDSSLGILSTSYDIVEVGLLFLGGNDGHESAITHVTGRGLLACTEDLGLDEYARGSWVHCATRTLQAMKWWGLELLSCRLSAFLVTVVTEQLYSIY